jgi:phospholipase C
VSPDAPKPVPRSPYRGIEPFRYVDRDNYFGQLRGTQELYAKILLYRLVVLFGESGAGKSSLLNAALIPAMQKEGVGAERLRVQPDPEQPISVERIPITAREDSDFLPSIFADKDADASKERVITCSLERFLPTVRAKAAEAHPLLIFDQFEELFTLFEQKGQDAAGAKALQHSVLDMLFQIVSDQNLQAKVVIVIREDFLGKLEVLAKRYPQVLDHRVRLRYFTQDDAGEAILGAFRREGRFQSRLTADLAQEVVGDLSGGAQDALVSPTQVQIICSRLWDTFGSEKAEIGVAEYRKLEGATGIVKGFFESELQQVDRELQPLAITILGNLITGSDTRDVVSEEKLRGLTGKHTTRPEDVSAILDILEARRLINKTSQRGTYFYEVSSEYLIAPIQKQSRKLAIDQATAEAEKKAADEAAEKAREASRTRDLEQAQALVDVQTLRADAKTKSAKRLRRGVIVLTAAFVLAVMASVYAIRLEYKAKNNEMAARVAETAARQAEKSAIQALLKSQESAQRSVGLAAELEKQNQQLADLYRQKGDSKLANQYTEQAAKNKQDVQAASRLASQQAKASDILARSQQPIPLTSFTQASTQPRAVKHLIVLMLENRSFDHMLGALKAFNPQIDGLTGSESNPDMTGGAVKVQPLADFQGQLQPDPGHSFLAADLQIFGADTSPGRVANMQGFVKNYFSQRQDAQHSKVVMYYFKPEKLPVLTTLAREFAVCDRWFSSVPGPTIPNRAFAHYGTSFGQIGMNLFYVKEPYKSIFERMVETGHTAKIYYYDQLSSSMEVPNLLQHHPELFGTFDQFLTDAQRGTLPEYSFVEPNYSDHSGDNGAVLANDQHPDHNVRQGEILIASVYNAIRTNPSLWAESLLLITYSNHGGMYDHVPPPAATPDGFVAPADQTFTGESFAFDRLGVRVPAVIISPYIPKGTVDHTVYDHASILATVSKLFLSGSQTISPRERNAHTFERVLTLTAPRKDEDIPYFNIQ